KFEESAINSRIEKVPPMILKSTNPPSIDKPPNTVINMDFKAPNRERSFVYQYPINRNEEMDVNSQNRYNVITLSDCTIPSIAVININKYKSYQQSYNSYPNKR